MPLGSYKGILIGLCIYVVFVVFGSLTEMHILNVLGSIPLILVTLLKSGHHILGHVRDRSVKFALLILVTIAFSALLNIQTIQFTDMSKYVIIYVFYILMFSLRYKPVYESDLRRYFITIIYVLIFLSFALGKNIELSEPDRLSGIFVNPNNFALIGLSLLFFIDENNDGRLFYCLIHLTIVIVLLFSGTLGAMLGYTIACMYKYWKKLAKFKYLYIGLFAVGVLAIFAFPEYALNIYPLNRMTLQIAAIQDQIHNIFDGNKINYGYLLIKYGPEALSGIWRLEHWAEVVREIVNSDAIRMVFGYGAGSSHVALKALPHNEYMRVLFEQGVVGFSLNIAFFVTIWARTLNQCKYIILIFFIFSFTENNLDNFLYMALFMMFLATCQKQELHASQKQIN